MKIIDSFIFYNELDMLKYRLSILNDYVDHFVLVESKFTFNRNQKELYFDKVIFCLKTNLKFLKLNTKYF